MLSHLFNLRRDFEVHHTFLGPFEYSGLNALRQNLEVHHVFFLNPPLKPKYYLKTQNEFYDLGVNHTLASLCESSHKTWTLLGHVDLSHDLEVHHAFMSLVESTHKA